MDSSIQRTLRRAAAAFAATFAFAACAGGGTTVSPLAPASGSSGTGSGTGTGTGAGGTGTGSGSGTGTATASPAASPTSTPAASGGSTASPSATTTPSATPSPAPTDASTTTPVSSLDVGPQVIDAALGQAAQVGILDPGYSGPIEVSIAGNQLENALLATALNLQSGVLNGEPGTADVLDINLAKLLSLGLLGQNSTVLNVCETAQKPNVCRQIMLVQNATLSQISANLSSAVIGPGTLETLQLYSATGLTDFTGFTVTSSNEQLTVTNLGNGKYSLGAAASVVPPASATITATDGMGHTIAIPVMVL